MTKVADMLFSDLRGLTLCAIFCAVGDDVVTLIEASGRKFRMFHYQDCCESVSVEDIVGDIADLIGEPIVMADEETSEGPDCGDSTLWTFYKLATSKGYVTIRWLGTSNGYYSERVNFEEIT